MKKHIVILVIGSLSAASCGEDSTPEPRAGYSEAFRETLANRAPPELREGERMYYEETWGQELLGGYPADFLVELWQSDTARWGEQFESYGFLVDPGDDLPVGFKRGSEDPDTAGFTCAVCHVARLDDGRIWSGFPAVGLQWSRFALDVDAAWVAAGNESQLDAEARDKFSQMPHPGVTNVEERGEPIVPIDFPPYMNLAPRDDLGTTGSAKNARSVIIISVFSFRGGVDNPVRFPEYVVTQPFVDYMSWLTTPPALEAGPLADRGAEVFDSAGCAGCHHPDSLVDDVVVEWMDGPELLPGESPDHPTGTISTDRAFFASSDFDGGVGDAYGDFLDFVVRQGLMFGPTNGYAPRDLHALFGSAPYLHNGSVPTLEDLLEPAAERPTTFDRLGFVVDISAEGMSNQGHEFGTELPEQDKAALVEYLRSL